MFYLYGISVYEFVHRADLWELFVNIVGEMFATFVSRLIVRSGRFNKAPVLF